MLKINVPECFLSSYKQNNWAGHMIDWFLIEFLVFMAYNTTLVLLMGKSRFYSVGLDNSKMFEPTYMDRMSNLIASMIQIDF